MPFENLKKIYCSLGPGILLAATAIGVSHLIQSVQAGAKYGYFFIIMIIVAHLIKYPFFSVAPKYSSVTKRSLLYGYYRLNPKYLFIYLIITLLSMFTIVAAVSVVAGGILANILNINLDIKIWSSLVLTICFLILLYGKYEFLDKIIKLIILILTISTIITLYLTYISPTTPKLPEHYTKFNFQDKADILFLIAFLGWMPCPLDCSVWNSIWIVEKSHNHQEDVYYQKSLLDFRIGFTTTAIVGVIFLMLGKLAFHSTGISLSEKSVGFIGQLFNSYKANIGNNAFIIISISAFCAMFSTVITCLDGFSRAMTKTINLLINKDKQQQHIPNEKITESLMTENKLYIKMTCFTFGGTIILIFCFFTNMKTLIYLATVISFLTTPFFAWFNLKLLTSNQYPKQYHPSKRYIITCYILIAILISFSGLFIYSRIAF